MTVQVELTEAELAALIRDATRDDPLPLVFGPGYVSIITGQPGSLAALQKLATLLIFHTEHQESPNG